ncbi:hypothetical protein JW756_06415, partial [Candidatus Woesearchaeota archaeon]|nr:hypothetical protein [Candidatus Woesearchaeota archaeon]
MDMSNKSLALLLVAAIVISLGGAIITLNELNERGATGMVDYSGTVQAIISTNVSCNIDSNITFGSAGKPTSTYVLSSNKDNSADSNFSDCTSGS